jgi:putative hydrolase of the HAD superfamily
MGRVKAVISDFGGVLTSPLAGSFAAYHEQSGIPLEDLGAAMAALTAARGINPLFELETGRLTEAEFLRALSGELSRRLSGTVAMEGFGERFVGNLEPNLRLIEYLRSLRGRGYKLAICTNNVREWAPLWRAMLPVEEIFEVVVDSAFVGHRKPEPEIFELTLSELAVPAEAALFIDDVAENCEGARALGMTAVWFQSNEQAIAEAEAALQDEAA